jgi:hypothetical protein
MHGDASLDTLHRPNDLSITWIPFARYEDPVRDFFLSFVELLRSSFLFLHNFPSRFLSHSHLLGIVQGTR